MDYTPRIIELNAPFSTYIKVQVSPLFMGSTQRRAQTFVKSISTGYLEKKRIYCICKWFGYDYRVPPSDHYRNRTYEIQPAIRTRSLLNCETSGTWMVEIPILKGKNKPQIFCGLKKANNHEI